MSEASISLSVLEKIVLEFDADNPEHYKQLERVFNESPQLRSLGLSLDLTNPDEPAGRLDPVQEFQRGGVGGRAVNGAIVSGLCDLVVGATGFRFLDKGNIATARVDVRFLRPLIAERVEAIGRIRRVKGNRVFSLVEVRDEKGRLCSRAQGVVVFGIGKRSRPNA